MATEIQFITDNVTDISPVRALVGLKNLCVTSTWGRGRFTDLSPLEGMPLTILNCSCAQVSDLTPLKGMPLTNLDCTRCKITDLSPLKGMKLTKLWIGGTQVADLSALKGMPLTSFACNESRVSDLSLLREMNLTELYVTSKNITKGLDVIRQMKRLTTINGLPPDEFWKKNDAEEFNK